ncbi:ribonuclease kappa-like [Portunus trituberculatus]|uniref:ribonuclease kappa-like n=1 Tax=Portunus trituberculatus TaxID=210409 RepID=UPI001E1CC75A|nr:ribonuclease kappa-like [Portunus trituberculatus]
MKICGPKCSLCCTLLSAWGIVQLGIMAVLFWVKSPAFIEDLSIPEEAHHDAGHFIDALDKSYKTIAQNCGIAAGMYVITLIISGWQVMVNKRS